MRQTIEAVIDERGQVHFLETIKFETTRRVLVTILPVSIKSDKSSSVDELAGLGDILDDNLEDERNVKLPKHSKTR